MPPRPPPPPLLDQVALSQLHLLPKRALELATIMERLGNVPVVGPFSTPDIVEWSKDFHPSLLPEVLHLPFNREVGEHLLDRVVKYLVSAYDANNGWLTLDPAAARYMPEQECVSPFECELHGGPRRSARVRGGAEPLAAAACRNAYYLGASGALALPDEAFIDKNVIIPICLTAPRHFINVLVLHELRRLECYDPLGLLAAECRQPFLRSINAWMRNQRAARHVAPREDYAGRFNSVTFGAGPLRAPRVPGSPPLTVVTQKDGTSCAMFCAVAVWSVLRTGQPLTEEDLRGDPTRELRLFMLEHALTAMGLAGATLPMLVAGAVPMPPADADVFDENGVQLL